MAFKNGKEAWEAMAGPGAKEMSKDQFAKKAADLGIPPGEAEKLFKDMDKDGDGKVSEEEMQNTVGVDADEMQDRMLDEFGNSDEAVKAADADGDGQVSKDEMKKMLADKLGVTPENADKLADEMMKKYDPDGDGKIDGETFKDFSKAKADDLSDRIMDKMGSADEAMKQWDKDGDGQLTEDEFLAGAKEMWKNQDKDGDGKMGVAEFEKAFGIGPDEIT